LSSLENKFSDIINETMSWSETPEAQLSNGTVVKKVLLNGLNKEVLLIIVDCYYSGLIVSDVSTICGILEAAELYQLKDVIIASLTYLIYQINIDNCIKLFQLGLQHKHKLTNASFILIKTYLNKAYSTVNFIWD
jgi:hypothetical protein